MKKLTILFVLLLLAISGATIANSAESLPPITVALGPEPMVTALCDVDQNLCVVTGGDIKAFCTDPGHYQYAFLYFDALKIEDGQELPERTDPMAIHAGTGEMQTSIWSLDVLKGCDWVMANEPLATGIAQAACTSLDDSLDRSLLERSIGYVHSCGIGLWGTLEAANGDPVRLHAVYRAAFKMAPNPVLHEEYFHLTLD